MAMPRRSSLVVTYENHPIDVYKRQLLDLPVVLVVTPRSMAYTVAPLLYGLQHFDPRIKIAGVIFNKVASKRHLTYLTQAATDAGVPVLGSLPRVDDISIPSRYLGLDVDDLAQIDRYADQVAEDVYKRQVYAQAADADYWRIANSYDGAFSYDVLGKTCRLYTSRCV